MNKENWEWIDINLLKTDGFNPNVMTPKEKEALKKNILKFGWNMPIITNLKLLVADGEQKLTVAKEMGLKEVPVLKKKLTETERLILRQSMNKLRGTHNEELDAEEFKKILSQSDLQELTELTAISEQEVINIINKIDKDQIKAEEVNRLYAQEVTCPKCGHVFKKAKES